MSTKLIAIGNKLMGDDGIAIYVAEKLKSGLEEKGIEVIIGETDFEYCLDKIYEGDRIIILDATYLGLEPGTISEIVPGSCSDNLFSQHGLSLVKAINYYYHSEVVNKNIEDDVLIIGIEGSSFEFSLTLSKELEKKLDVICSKVVNKIIH